MLVLGMHRSGTSAATRVISLLGADLPKSLMAPAPDNPRGFWESQPLESLHNSLLSNSGSHWRDWKPFCWPMIPPDAQDRLADALQQEFGDSPLFVVKDPRICRLVPLWLGLLERLGTQPLAVLPLRHPFEAAHSLRRRNGMHLATGCALWLRHVLEAEHHTRGIPRGFVRYGRLLTNWQQELGTLTGRLGIEWPRSFPEAAPEIEAFLAPELRHHDASAEVGQCGDIVSWVQQAYGVLEGLATSGESPAAYDELDRLKAVFDQACARPAEWMSHDEAGSRAARQVDEAVRARQAMEAQLSAVQTRLRAQTAELNDSRLRCSEAAARIKCLEGQSLALKRAAAWTSPVSAKQRFRRWRDNLWLRLRRRTLLQSKAFDAEWYMQQYPDVATAGCDPLEHWLEHGLCEGRNPSPAFDTLKYLEEQPHLAGAGKNPLAHFLRRGAGSRDAATESRTLAGLTAKCSETADVCSLRAQPSAAPDAGASPALEASLKMPLRELLPRMQARIMSTSRYFGVPTLKCPLDFWVYQEILCEQRPDVIIEIGNNWGGSTLALAHLCDNLGHGRVIGCDISHHKVGSLVRSHPRITLIEGDACARFADVQSLLSPGETVLVIEDSSHTYENTLAVLRTYSPLIAPGGHFIVEHSICHHGLDVGPKPGPYEAIEAFLQENENFVTDRQRESFIVTWNPLGFLRRKS